MTQLLIQHRRRTQLDPAAETVDPCREPMTGLPLLGRVSAGHPVEAIEDPEWVQAPQRLAGGASYALRVQGDSMRDEQIEDGDLVLIARRQTAEDGETVVALVDEGRRGALIPDDACVHEGRGSPSAQRRGVVRRILNRVRFCAGHVGLGRIWSERADQQRVSKAGRRRVCRWPSPQRPLDPTNAGLGFVDCLDHLLRKASRCTSSE
jgi:hypothetical protein